MSCLTKSSIGGYPSICPDMSIAWHFGSFMNLSLTSSMKPSYCCKPYRRRLLEVRSLGAPGHWPTANIKGNQDITGSWTNCTNLSQLWKVSNGSMVSLGIPYSLRLSPIPFNATLEESIFAPDHGAWQLHLQFSDSWLQTLAMKTCILRVNGESNEFSKVFLCRRKGQKAFHR